MSEGPELPQPEPELPVPDVPTPEMPPTEPEDSRITILLVGQTSMPKAIDFHRVNAFQLLAIGEWLALKGKQMIAASEEAETGQIQIPRLATPAPQEILRARK